MHTIWKKTLKQKTSTSLKTTGLSIKLSVNKIEGLILAETIGYKRLVHFVCEVGPGYEVLDRSLEITGVCGFNECQFSFQNISSSK